MPLLVDRGSDPRIAKAAAGCVEIGLVNNMPDTALEATERQFVTLLEAASVDVRVRLRFFSLPGVPRGECGQRHVARFYRGLRELPGSGLDALIVTGTEPRAASLRTTVGIREDFFAGHVFSDTPENSGNAHASMASPKVATAGSSVTRLGTNWNDGPICRRIKSM